VNNKRKPQETEPNCLREKKGRREGEDRIRKEKGNQNRLQRNGIRKFYQKEELKRDSGKGGSS